MFERAKKFLRKLFGLKESKIKVVMMKQKPTLSTQKPIYGVDYLLEPNYPPSCHMIRFPERVTKPGSQAIHKISPKNFKPRPAHERKLLNPKAKLEEEN